MTAIGKLQCAITLMCAMICAVFAQGVPGGDETLVEAGFLERLLVGNPWHDWYYDNMDAFVHGYELARNINEPMIFIEIGVCYATHVDHLLQSTNNVTVHGVDPYLANYDPLDFVAVSGDQGHFDKIYWNVMDKMSHWRKAGRYVHHRSRSWDALETFTDGSVDIIFVDGDHRYRAVLTDIEDYWPKLRAGGIMLGDDYEFDRYGVKQAVDEFAAENKLDVRFLDNGKHLVWYVQKPHTASVVDGTKSEL